MTDRERIQALELEYARLRAVTSEVIENARPAAAPEDAVVDATLLVRARRELDGEPQPSAFATMSIS